MDALTATRFEGQLEGVFARGQVVMRGRRCCVGSVAGGYLAQLTNLGVPYLARTAILIGMFVVAMIMMHDLGFTPDRGARPFAEMKDIVNSSVEHGLKVPAVRAIMLAGMFTGGVGIYVFYALQPHLLNLWGDPAGVRDRRSGGGDRSRSPDRRRAAHAMDPQGRSGGAPRHC